jgi:hypothetical protein
MPALAAMLEAGKELHLWSTLITTGCVVSGIGSPAFMHDARTNSSHRWDSLKRLHGLLLAINGTEPAAVPLLMERGRVEAALGFV